MSMKGSQIVYWRDQALKLIAFLKTKNYTNQEIGKVLGISEEAVVMITGRYKTGDLTD